MEGLYELALNAGRKVGLGKRVVGVEFDKRHQKFLDRRNELLKSSSHLIAHDANGRDFTSINQNLESILANLSTYFDLDPEHDAAIIKEIRERINNYGNEIGDEKLKKLEKDLQVLNDDFSRKVEEGQEDDAQRWKYRALQFFLLVSPIGPISLVGGALSWLQIFEAFGPIFEKGLTFGESVGEVFSKFTFGISDKMQFDKISEFLFDSIPLVKEPFELFAEIRNNEAISLGLGLVGETIIPNPLFALGLVATYSVWNMGKEIDHHTKSNKTQKEYHEKMIDIMSKYKIDNFDKQQANAKRAADEIFELSQKIKKVEDIKNNLCEEYKKNPDLFSNNENLLNVFNAYKNSNLNDVKILNIGDAINECGSIKNFLDRIIKLDVGDINLKNEIDKLSYHLKENRAIKSYIENNNLDPDYADRLNLEGIKNLVLLEDLSDQLDFIKNFENINDDPKKVQKRIKSQQDKVSELKSSIFKDENRSDEINKLAGDIGLIVDDQKKHLVDSIAESYKRNSPSNSPSPQSLQKTFELQATK